MHAAIAKEILATGRPLRAPACVLSGGETTVTIRGTGLGGRNQEFVLAAAIALDGAGPVTVFSAGTDGTDGPTDAAGAIADSTTVCERARPASDAAAFSREQRLLSFFRKGRRAGKNRATGTNVMDVRVVLVGGEVGRKLYPGGSEI